MRKTSCDGELRQYIVYSVVSISSIQFNQSMRCLTYIYKTVISKQTYCYGLPGSKNTNIR